MGNEVVAEELLAPTAVVAVSTQLGVVCHHAISKLEALNPAAKCCDYTHSLMAGDKRKLPFVVSNPKSQSFGLTYLSSKFTIVDVQVCATHPRGLHFYLRKLLDVK
jgi:hypothetical protein